MIKIFKRKRKASNQALLHVSGFSLSFFSCLDSFCMHTQSSPITRLPPISGLQSSGSQRVRRNKSRAVLAEKGTEPGNHVDLTNPRDGGCDTV